jgi:hypothetical protein
MATEYKIRMGLPEMAKYWVEMNEKQANGKLSKTERELFGKVKKALRLLRTNPHHPGLNSHEIGVLSKREKFRVFESYLENNTPAAGRIFWTYGPDKADITILGIVPHPESGSYGRVHLSGKAAAAPVQAPKMEKKTTKKKK